MFWTAVHDLCALSLVEETLLPLTMFRKVPPPHGLHSWVNPINLLPENIPRKVNDIPILYCENSIVRSPSRADADPTDEERRT